VIKSFSNHLELRKWVRNKHALVVGLGRSGLAVSKLLLKLGAKISITDQRSPSSLTRELQELGTTVPLQTGNHSWVTDKRFDFVIASPGVPWEMLELKIARQRIPVWNEIGFALDATPRPYATSAITGTNGKTTTTTLVAEIMKRNQRPVVMAGNVGTPVSSVADKIDSQTILVLEISSYQLEGLPHFQPDVGCLLNVTPDHLKRHKTMNHYARIKISMFKHQHPQQVAILNADDPWCRRLASLCSGEILWLSASRELPGQAYSNGSQLILDHTMPSLKLPKPGHLIGPHNTFNSLAAAASAYLLGAQSNTIAQTLRQFRGVEHRLETVARLKGTLYVNDSKSTNVDSTFVALQSFREPLLLILGGQHKGSSYKPLIPLVQRLVKKIFLNGEAATLIKKDLNGTVPLEDVRDLSSAVRRSYESAKPGDVVLLSPACASFDQFNNFEHRGQAFRKLVLSLSKSP